MKTDNTLAFACLLYLAGSAISPARATGHDALETVQQKFAAFNRHDAETIEQLYASDAALHSPDYPNLSGNRPIADTYRKIFAAIPDAQDRLTSLERAGNHVYAQFMLTGHLGGAQDKPVSVRLISVYTVKKDRIVEDDTYYDRKM
jgi:ketosteroid isomerase-like protein